MGAFLLIVAFAIAFGIFYSRQKKNAGNPITFPIAWKKILEEKVLFYHNLSEEDKKRFERDIVRFLNNVCITGVNTQVDITDKILVASSATIPVFGFPDWDYTFLDEVLLYPASFDSKYTINSKEETITGMVGSGSMEGKMILSKPSLHRGFDNTRISKMSGYTSSFT